MEYIPSGISKAQWAKMKEDEKNKKNGKNLGQSGITTFKSRSFSDWQKAGGVNLFPVNPKGLDPKDIPYMQRPGGMADNSDLIGKKKTGGAFSFGGKKKAPAAAPVAPPMKAGSFSFGGKKAPAPVPVAAKKAGKFSFGGKKKAPEPEPEAPKKKNFFGL